MMYKIRKKKKRMSLANLVTCSFQNDYLFNLPYHKAVQLNLTTNEITIGYYQKNNNNKTILLFLKKPDFESELKLTTLLLSGILLDKLSTTFVENFFMEWFRVYTKVKNIVQKKYNNAINESLKNIILRDILFIIQYYYM